MNGCELEAASVGTSFLSYVTLINLVVAKANRYADTAALFQALGGGWWNRSDVVVKKGRGGPPPQKPFLE